MTEFLAVIGMASLALIAFALVVVSGESIVKLERYGKRIDWLERRVEELLAVRK